MILLSGFKKFGKFTENSSEIIISKLPNHIYGERIEKLILPVSWKRSIQEYMDFLCNINDVPKLILLLGIHSGTKIHIERCSWNIKFGIDMDNTFKCGFIDYGNKLRIKSIIDLKKIILPKLQLKDIKISNFSGYYLCNYVYFHALKVSKKEYPVIFIHLPNKNVIKRYYNTFRNNCRNYEKINFIHLKGVFALIRLIKFLRYSFESLFHHKANLISVILHYRSQFPPERFLNQYFFQLHL